MSLRDIQQRYSNGSDRPLGSYVILMSVYAGLVASLVGFGRKRRVRLPDRLPPADVLLLAVGTYRLARLISKDSVTSPLRAPFVRFKRASAPDELEEEVIGSGLQHAVGEWITCPLCLGLWVATVGTFALLVWPRPTRLVCTTLGVATAGEWLQYLNTAVQKLE